MHVVVVPESFLKKQNRSGEWAVANKIKIGALKKTDVCNKKRANSRYLLYADTEDENIRLNLALHDTCFYNEKGLTRMDVALDQMTGSGSYGFSKPLIRKINTDLLKAYVPFDIGKAHVLMFSRWDYELISIDEEESWCHRNVSLKDYVLAEICSQERSLGPRNASASTELMSMSSVFLPICIIPIVIMRMSHGATTTSI
ncbi:hypothetical protein Tco_0360276 [Tanacetum coccineum]